jgi:AcrR family transcriptional regulator
VFVGLTRDVREALLDSAYDAALSGDWDRTRMADVAACAKVSRQTLYNEFSSKEGLAAALTLREAGRFLEVVDRAVQGAASPREAIRMTVMEALRAASDNPLIKAALAGAHSSELLPFLTTRGEPTIHLADERLAQGMAERFPGLSQQSLGEVADVVVRLTISHIVSPAGPIEDAAASIERLVAPLLEVDQ